MTNRLTMQTRKDTNTPSSRDVLLTSQQKQKPWGIGTSQKNKKAHQKDKSCKQSSSQNYDFVGIAG